MTVDPVSIAGAIHVLSAASTWVARIISDFRDAPRKVLDLQHDCKFTAAILLKIKVAIEAGNLPGSADAESLQLLQDTIDQIRDDITSLLPKLERLCLSHKHSRMERWRSKSIAAWKTSHFDKIHGRMDNHRKQIQLFANVNSWCHRTDSFTSEHDRRDLAISRSSSTITGSEELQAKLVAAVKYQNVDQVDRILRQSVDPNFVADAELGLCPLHIAAKHNSIDIVQALLSHGADPNVTTKEGHTPLMEAIIRESRSVHTPDTAVIQLLLKPNKNGIATNLNIKTTKSQQTALHLAAEQSHPEVLKVLLTACQHPKAPSQQAPSLLDPINTPDKEGFTLLHRAAFLGDLPLLTLLLTHGANPLFPSADGQLPLHLACINGQKPIILHLLKHDDKTIDPIDDRGMTPLILAAGYGHDALLHTLISHGANISHKSNDGVDALYAACANGHIPVAAYLFGKGANINGRDNRGNTPLHVAARRGHVEMVRWLVGMGADRGLKSWEAFEGVHVIGTAAEVARGVEFEEEGLGESIFCVIERGG